MAGPGCGLDHIHREDTLHAGFLGTKNRKVPFTGKDPTPKIQPLACNGFSR